MVLFYILVGWRVFLNELGREARAAGLEVPGEALPARRAGQ